MPRSSLLPSSTAPRPESESGAAEQAVARPKHVGRDYSLRHRFTKKLAAPIRWLHIYLSMFGLAIVLFFSATGLTLNHPEWFSGAERRETVQGQVDTKWLHAEASATAPATEPAAPAAEVDESRQVAKLEVVEFLRKSHAIHGEMSEFRVDDQECNVSFKGPGYAADAVINRSTGKYELVQTRYGFVAVINDLHKGRDTGRKWAWVIDISAYLLIFISLTGVALLLYIKRRRMSGLVVAVVGIAIVMAAIMFLVP